MYYNSKNSIFGADSPLNLDIVGWNKAWTSRYLSLHI